MLSINLSEAEANRVNIERKNDKSAIVRDRMTALHLTHLGYKRKQVAHILGCHINTVTNYLKLYLCGGLDKVRQLGYSWDKHELSDQMAEVERKLEQSNSCTVEKAAQQLAEHFNYTRSEEAVRQLLHRLGFKRRKVGTLPGKIRDFDKWQQQQRDYIKKLDGLTDQAEQGFIDLAFCDAAHFVYGKFSSYCWAKSARYAPSGHGRFRLNVYGAYDPVSNQVYSMYNEDYINADFMLEYFEWLREYAYTDQSRSLHIVLDNARYQHCNVVKHKAASLNIVLEFLPAYSPNLNLIERLWRYLKKILAKQYHECKNTFSNAVVNLLESLESEIHQTKIWTLLNPKYQQFENSQILTW